MTVRELIYELNQIDDMDAVVYFNDSEWGNSDVNYVSELVDRDGSHIVVLDM